MPSRNRVYTKKAQKMYNFLFVDDRYSTHNIQTVQIEKKPLFSKNRFLQGIVIVILERRFDGISKPKNFLVQLNMILDDRRNENVYCCFVLWLCLPDCYCKTLILEIKDKNLSARLEKCDTP